MGHAKAQSSSLPSYSQTAALEDSRFQARPDRLDASRQRGHWKAVVYMPGAIMCEPAYPTGEDRDEVIAEAKRVIESP